MGQAYTLAPAMQSAAPLQRRYSGIPALRFVRIVLVIVIGITATKHFDTIA